MIGDISVILTGYKRPEYLELQLEHLKKQSIQPKEIFLWINKSDKKYYPYVKSPRDYKVIDCDFNYKFHGRFAFALLCKTKYIAIFDDDCFPQENWFKNCLNSVEKCNGILGTSGVRLIKDSYHPNSKVGWNGTKSTEIEQVHLVGHAWFFKKEWLKYMWQEEPLSWDNGEDIQFSALSFLYGGIKTFVPPHPETDKTLWGNNIKLAVQVGDDINATHLHTKSHYIIRNELCKKYVNRGWKP